MLVLRKQHRCFHSSLALLLMLFSPLVTSSRTQGLYKRLSNQDIIEMTSSGLSDEVIIAKIRSTSGADSLKFDTSVEGLKALKAANVSDAVIKVMINPTPPQAPIVAGSPMSVDPNLPPPEIGVYWKDGPTFVLLQGKTLTQARSVAVQGASSPTEFALSTGTRRWKALLHRIALRTAGRFSIYTFPMAIPRQTTC